MIEGTQLVSEVKFLDRKSALKQKNKAACEKILLFVMQYHPAVNAV